MPWYEQVHGSRMEQTLSDARLEYAARKKNQPFREPEIAKPLPSLVILGAATTAFLIKQHRARLQKVQWRSLPIVKHFHDLVFGSGGTKLRSNKSKNKKPSKVTAASVKPVEPSSDAIVAARSSPASTSAKTVAAAKPGVTPVTQLKGPKGPSAPSQQQSAQGSAAVASAKKRKNPKPVPAESISAGVSDKQQQLLRQMSSEAANQKS